MRQVNLKVDFLITRDKHVEIDEKSDKYEIVSESCRRVITLRDVTHDDETIIACHLPHCISTTCKLAVTGNDVIIPSGDLVTDDVLSSRSDYRVGESA